MTESKAPESVSTAHAFRVLEKVEPTVAEVLVEQGLDPESEEALECHRRNEAEFTITDTSWSGIFFGLRVPDPDWIPF